MNIRKELAEKFVRSLSKDALIKTWCFLIKDSDEIIRLRDQRIISFDYAECLKLIDNENNLKIILSKVDKSILDKDDFKGLFDYTFDLYYGILVDGSEITLQVLEGYTKLDDLELIPETRTCLNPFGTGQCLPTAVVF